jgi:serine/threonine protein kinase
MGCGGSGGTAKKGDPAAGKRLLEEYSVGQTLGEGAFGVVYACTNRTSGEEVAVKMVDKVETPVEAIRKEAEMLKSMDCKNIVKVHQIFYERCFVCIVMDKFSGGDLVEGLHLHLKEKGKINCHDIVHVSNQMGNAINHLTRGKLSTAM